MSKNWIAIIGIGLLIAFGITLFSPLASSHPDGLEKVAEEKDFIDEGKDPSYEIIPDYTFPGIENESVATILSGIVGVAIVAAGAFAIGFAMQALTRSRRRTAGEPRRDTGEMRGAG